MCQPVGQQLELFAPDDCEACDPKPAVTYDDAWEPEPDEWDRLP